MLNGKMQSTRDAQDQHRIALALLGHCRHASKSPYVNNKPVRGTLRDHGSSWTSGRRHCSRPNAKGNQAPRHPRSRGPGWVGCRHPLNAGYVASRTRCSKAVRLFSLGASCFGLAYWTWRMAKTCSRRRRREPSREAHVTCATEHRQGCLSSLQQMQYCTAQCGTSQVIDPRVHYLLASHASKHSSTSR